jgi:hypothetical protein
VIPKIRIPLHDHVRERAQLDRIWQVHANRDAADTEPDASAEVHMPPDKHVIIGRQRDATT